MSTEDDSKEQNEPKMTPQEMLQKTKNIYESLVGKSPKIKLQKPEVIYLNLD